jgi:hypothetical protein
MLAPIALAGSMTYHSCKDSRVVKLEWTDDYVMLVWTTDNPPKNIGSFEFKYIEGPSSSGDDDYYHLQSMFLEGPDCSRKYLQQGIGRAIIKEVGSYGLPIVFTQHDGIKRDDGSHLIGDGPPFATTMVSEGLARWDSNNREEF